MRKPARWSCSIRSVGPIAVPTKSTPAARRPSATTCFERCDSNRFISTQARILSNRCDDSFTSGSCTDELYSPLCYLDFRNGFVAASVVRQRAGRAADLRISNCRTGHGYILGRQSDYKRCRTSSLETCRRSAPRHAYRMAFARQEARRYGFNPYRDVEQRALLHEPKTARMGAATDVGINQNGRLGNPRARRALRDGFDVRISHGSVFAAFSSHCE